jgi:hypothetical protein
VLYLQITGPIPIFKLYPCASRSLIQPFALHDVGNTLIERRYHPYVEHIPSVG